MKSQNISREELVTLLSQVEKSTFVNLVTETKVRMNKRNNPYFDKVVKRSKCNYLIGNEYESRVNKNYTKEELNPTFQSEECKVGNHISKCVLFNEKSNSHYLMVERFDEIKPQVEYTFEGNGIDKQVFEGYMTKVYESQKQEQERKVMVITFKIDNIKEVSLEGNHYIVEG